MRLLAAAAAAMLLVAAACGGDTGEAIEVADDPPVFSPGAVAGGQVIIDETTIDYVTVTPEGFQAGDEAPVLLAMPPGGQDLTLTESIVSSVYATEALARGWVVLSPAAPDGQLYFNGSEVLIPGLLAWMASWVDIEGGKPHVAGISNGGISSFRLAANNPEAFRSVIAFPGFPRSGDDKEALAQLTDVVVRMYVGETDIGWVGPMEQTFGELTELGGDVSLDIRAGEGHIISSLSDGVEIFDQLDAAR